MAIMGILARPSISIKMQKRQIKMNVANIQVTNITAGPTEYLEVSIVSTVSESFSSNSFFLDFSFLNNRRE